MCSPAGSGFTNSKVCLIVSEDQSDRLTPSLTNWSLKCRRSPTASRRSIDRTRFSTIHTAELTVTGHRNRHVYIELQILLDSVVDGKRVVWCTIKELSEIVLFISLCATCRISRRTKTSKKIMVPTRAVKTPPRRD
jgi:hypothetical protein